MDIETLVHIPDSFLYQENGPGKLVWESRHLLCVDFDGKIGIYTKSKHDYFFTSIEK